MKRRLGLRLAMALLALGGLWAAWRSDAVLFERPEAREQRLAASISRALVKKQGLHFLMTFDEERPREWVHRRSSQWPGTMRVPGRRGNGRKFDGRESTYVSTATSWAELGDSFTLSIWVRFDDAEGDQSLWTTSFMGKRVGFRLEGGRLRFHVPGKSDSASISYPFANAGRWVHLVGVADGPGGTARLYEDGRLMGATAIDGVSIPDHCMEFGKASWYGNSTPLFGTIDEAAAWNRALTEREVQALGKGGISSLLGSRRHLHWAWKASGAWNSGVRQGLRLLDRFHPGLHDGRLAQAGIDELNLKMRNADRRRLSSAHELSLGSGRRIRSGAAARDVHASHRGRTFPVRVWLDGSDMHYPDCRRASYVVESDDLANAFGSSRVRLLPPESFADDLWRLGDRDVRWVRLTINGNPLGTYVAEGDLPTTRKHWGSAWVAEGPDTPVAWRFAFRPPPPRGTLFADGEEELRAGLRRAARLLANDVFHPWSAREWAWRTRRAPSAPEPLPREFAALGSNPAPYFIVADLDLAAAFPGQETAWTSSRPETIDGQGRVTAPDGDAPVAVALRGMPTGGEGVGVELHFRVMPRTRKLPALMLHFDEPLNKCARVDFDAAYWAAGETDAPRWLRGDASTRGGAKHRGNTSYWRGAKKPVSLRFNAPHRLLDDTETVHLYLLNGYYNSTKTRNKMTFDAFRSFGGEGAAGHAPVVGWAEVFVNGVYQGVYETCTRVHRDMLGMSRDDEGSDDPPGLYKLRPANDFFRDPDSFQFDQLVPSVRRRIWTDPLREFVEFVRTADAERFAAEIGERLDLANAADFILLLNWTRNEEGSSSFYLARRGGGDSRYFIVPFDYDKSFPPRGEWVSNRLFNRLRHDLPGFEERMRKRWAELRGGPLSDEAVMAQLDEMERTLSGYLEWEFAAFRQGDGVGAEEHFARERQRVQAGLDFVDGRLGRHAPSP